MPADSRFWCHREGKTSESAVVSLRTGKRIRWFWILDWQAGRADSVTCGIERKDDRDHALLEGCTSLSQLGKRIWGTRETRCKRGGWESGRCQPIMARHRSDWTSRCSNGTKGARMFLSLDQGRMGVGICVGCGETDVGKSFRYSAMVTRQKSTLIWGILSWGGSSGQSQSYQQRLMPVLPDRKG